MRHTTFFAIPICLSFAACQGMVDVSGRRGDPTAPMEPSPVVGLPPVGGDVSYRTPDIHLPLPAPPPPVPTPTPPPPPPPPLAPQRPPTQPSFDYLTATPAPEGAPRALPVIGGTLLVLRSGRTAVASDPDRNRIFIVDLERGSLLREIVLEPGSEPGRLAEDAGGRVHVALRSGGQLVTLAPETFALAQRRAVCPAPRGVAAPGGGRVYVACAGGELVALPEQGETALWTRRLERDLRDILVDADGAGLIVSTFRSARLLRVDLEGNPREELSLPVSLNLTRRSRSGPEGPAATRFTPSVAWRMLPAAGGGVLVLHQRGFTGELPIDGNSGPGSGGYTGHGCGGGPVQTVVSLVGAPGRRLPPRELSHAVLTVDAALSRDGRWLAMVSPADAHAREMGSTVLTGPVDQVIAGGDTGCMTFGLRFAEQQGMPWGTEDRTATHQSRLRGEAVAVAFDGQDDLVVQLRQPAELLVPRRGIRVRLSDESRADVGHAVFHANTGGGIACASCHPEGSEDGRVWRFASLGLRRTQSLRGGVSQTAPLHWDGDMQDVPHIAREVFTARMGGPPLTAPEAEALAGWIDAIPMLPLSPPPDADAVARGRAVFLSGETGCAACHNGPRLTNNLTADVGTGRPMQVPSLLGLGARAPYMHTGCAPTLAGRFSADCGGGTRHGVTTTLTSQQAADLQAFLESM
jgi:hypothetical protein